MDVLQGLDPQPFEIIVVEGEGGEAIEDLCTAASCRLLSSPPRRGEQMDRGARAAGGDVLWFLHADAEPPPESLAVMNSHLSSGAIGGWFRFAFRNETCWQARLLSGLVNLRARLGVPYGDQGLFMSRGGLSAGRRFSLAAAVRRTAAGSAVAETGSFPAAAGPPGRFGAPLEA